SGVSAGLAITITGVGFDPIAANNRVTFAPAAGPAFAAAATSIETLDSASGTQRLTVTVPSEVPTGTVTVRVASGSDVSEPRALEIVALSLPETRSASPGDQGVAVRIAGSPNTRFGPGTRITLGAGIAVRTTTVESPTTLLA